MANPNPNFPGQGMCPIIADDLQPRVESTEPDSPSLTWIVKVNTGGVKRLWVKTPANPTHHAVVFFVLRILDSIQRILVAPNTTTIFRRARPFPSNTPWVLHLWNPLHHFV